MILRGSSLGAEHTLDRDLSDQRRIESKLIDLHRHLEELSATEVADVDSISSDRINEIVVDEILTPDFQVEASAEEFFNKSHGVGHWEPSIRSTLSDGNMTSRTGK